MTPTTQPELSPFAPVDDDLRSRADSARRRESRDAADAGAPAKRSRRRFDDIF